MNQLRREHRAKVAAVPWEMASNDRRSKEILNCSSTGSDAEAWKEELRKLEQRRTELQEALANAEKAPALPALHSGRPRLRY